MSCTQTPNLSPRDIEHSGELNLTKRGCCFWIPCLGSDHSSEDGWERIRKAESKEPWWCRGWNKIREWSEIVAGPKWKTFIRRFNKTRPGTAGRSKFHYDPLSYARNFDEGPGQNSLLDDDYAYRDFSSRYAAIPASAKSSMDFGKDGFVFTSGA